MRTTQLLLLASTVLAIGGIRLFPAPSPQRLLVSGHSNLQPRGIGWGVVICPPEGATVEGMAFIAQGTSIAGALPYATLIAEDHTTGETLCGLQVPCDVTVRATAQTSECPDIRCTPGGPVHIEWAPDPADGGSLSGCLLGNFPAGAGSATLRLGR